MPFSCDGQTGQRQYNAPILACSAPVYEFPCKIMWIVIIPKQIP